MESQTRSQRLQKTTNTSLRFLLCAMRGRDKTNPSHRGKANENYEQRLEIRKDGYSNALTTIQKDNLVIVIKDCT